MKLSLSISLSLLLGAATLFQGCGATDDTETAASERTATISGTTTLSSGFQSESKATVCLDLNENRVCDDDEPTTTTDILGEYKFTLPSKIETGTTIIAFGGKSMLPREDGNYSQPNQLVLYKYYNQAEYVQNINVMSTAITQEMLDNPSYTYEDVIANFENRYGYERSMLLSDPIEVSQNIFGDGEEFFKTVSALEIYMNRLSAAAHPTSSLHRAAEEESTLPTADELDLIIEEYTSLFDEYLTWISDWWESLWADDEDEPVTEEPVVEEPVVEEPVVEEPEGPVEVSVSKDILSGIWYIIDASGDKTCSEIDSANDEISVTEADGKTTDLSMIYDDDAKSMELKLGFFSADTIFFTKYMSDETFEGYYGSDGETLNGEKMNSLAACKSEKLGL